MPTLIFEVDLIEPYRQFTRLEAMISGAGLSTFLGISAAPYIRQRAASRFENEGDKVSGKWARLRESTRQYRIAQNYDPDGPINVRTGALKDYILNAPNTIMPTSLGATMKSPGELPSNPLTKKKLSTAQFGQSANASKRQSRTVARPVMGVNEADTLYITTALAEHIMSGGLI